jgi:hypothetical protein
MIMLRPDGQVNEEGSMPLVRVSSDAAVVAVRSALQAQLRGESSSQDLQRAIRLMCEEARRKDLRAEQLLIVFKRAWHSLPEVEQLPRGLERTDLLNHVISLCIDEFYAGAERDRL